MANSNTKYARTSDFELTNTTASTAILSAQGFLGSHTYAANSLAEGDSIIVRTWGNLDTAAGDADPGSLLFHFFFPPEVIPWQVLVTLPPNLSGVSWELYIILTVRGTNLVGSMRFSSVKGDLWDACAVHTNLFDKAQANTMEIKAKFSVASESNVLTVRVSSIENLPAP